jgi:protein-tyrosine phosphatase
MPLLLSLLIAIILAGVFAFWFLRIQTYHQITVQPGVLYRCGNRGIREFSTTIRQVKPTVVVPLVDDAELADPEKHELADELTYLAQHGVHVERIPVKLGGWPTTDDIRKFLSLIEDPQNRPVLVHCAQGVRRTGMFVAAYQLTELKWSKEQTKAAVETFGHSQRTSRDMLQFIDDYDPATRTVTVSRASTGAE